MLVTAPVLPSHGARITNDSPCVWAVLIVKVVTWSEPTTCGFEVQARRCPLTACWRVMEQRSQPATCTWSRVLARAGLVDDAAWASVWAVVARAAAARVSKMAAARRRGVMALLRIRGRPPVDRRP